MSTLLLTVSIAFVIVVASIAFLAIGKLLTGRSKLQTGACGRDPTKKKNDKSGCGPNSSGCNLCDQDKND